MSLIRQIWLLLLCTLLLAFAGGVVIHVGSTRDILQTQLRIKNSDNATSLAQVLSQQKGDPASMELTLAAQFDTGFYRRIRLVGADARTLVSREGKAPPRMAPGWFVSLFPIDSMPGVAQVSDGWRALGSVEVVSQTAFAYDELWLGSVRSALALALLGLVAGGIAAIGVQRIRRPLDGTVEQASSLQRGEYLTLAEPDVPELRRLTRAMNSMVERLRTVFEAQAEQVESMRRQASCDPLTGLSNRSHFMAQLAAALQREGAAPDGGLVLLRVLHLNDMNRALGRENIDRLIVTVGQTLQTYAAHVGGSFVGRLNGADFALVLPEGGIAHESAEAVVNLLRAELPIFAPQGTVAAGAVEMRHGAEIPKLLAHADMALARAESAGPFSVMSEGEQGGTAWAGAGERGWHERVRQALDEGRVQLGSFAVVGPAGKVIHLECPLRVQLDPNGPYEAASHWLPLANRSRLNGAIDERGLALALDAIARDGQARCINISPASLLDSGFASRLRTQLRAQPRAARHVWLEVSEAAAADQFEVMRELARQVRPTGARFGLEHAGERLSRIDRLFEAGLDYVKLDAAVVHGVALDPSRASFVKGLVTMLHSLSVQVFGEGVTDPADAKILWECGIDGLTGPWISTQVEESTLP